ncbi:hypothetical protein GGH13_003313 [Coemansia sp. S155-1]|nr:hypothetical protein GGH13_003313 [Coemansia sp. S155-1]
MTTTTAADATQGHGKNGDNEQRLQAMGDRLKQVLGTEIGVDREQVLAKVAELRALAKELEDFAGSLNSTAAKPVLVNSTFPRSTRKTMVKMPRLGTVFADASGEEGGEFNTQVAIPPGGLTFIASAAVMQESDDDDSVSASVDIADIADAMRGAVLEPNDVMPTPARADDDGPTTVTHAETGTESVGGFAHPTESFAKTVLAQATQGVSAAVVAPQMPIPADHTPAAGGVPPPSGFDVYGMASWPPPATPVSASAVDGSAASSAMPAMYGALPLPYPLPHPLAMHCGFLPPLMYGVPPSMGSPVVPGGGAAPPPPPGLGSTAAGHSLGMPPSSAASSDALAAQQQSELWVPEHGVVDASGVPRSKMVMAMPGTDHYQHAVAAAAAAAAAGYPMNVPFMYPHIDSSNISAAATGGGSENNESVVSVDSNRGVASRFGSMHYPPQQHQQQHQQPLAGDSARGFNEYPPAMQYMWPEHSKHMAQGAYPYVHQGYHQGSAGHQGYRRRGSGSNNSSGSGSANGSNANTNNNNNNSSGGSNSGNNYHHNQHHQHQSRDRRGNTGGGYPRQQQQQQQQQRWNNNNNNNSGGYNPRHQHHHHHHNQQQHRHQSPHNSSTYSQDAGSAPGFSGVAASEVSVGSSNSGYYSNNNNIPK